MDSRSRAFGHPPVTEVFTTDKSACSRSLAEQYVDAFGLTPQEISAISGDDHKETCDEK